MNIKDNVRHEKNIMDRSLTAYCGLCCGDCIPSNAAFFSLVQSLDDVLNKLQFEDYARLKSEKNPIFKEYRMFLQVLREIKSLKCTGPCRNGGGKTECEVRNCVQSRGYDGCWECDVRSTCHLLDPLRGIHPNIGYHLELIRQYGLEEWFKKRRAHYRWQQGGMVEQITAVDMDKLRR
jgi:hypothetical protein